MKKNFNMRTKSMYKIKRKLCFNDICKGINCSCIIEDSNTDNNHKNNDNDIEDEDHSNCNDDNDDDDHHHKEKDDHNNRNINDGSKVMTVKIMII